MDPSPAYAAFMILAALVFVLARRCFPQPGYASLPRAKRVGLAFGGFLGGTLGAKLPFFFAASGEWSGVWLADGKTVTTGLAGAYLGVELAKRVLGVRVGTGDSFAIPLALSLAVGRWGCFFHGCCHGVPTELPWGVDFGDGVRRHPTQAYESLFHLAMAFALLAAVCGDKFRGHRLKLYLIAYATFRFATEFIRPEPAYAAGLTFFQWVAILGAAALATQWWRDRRCPHLPQSVVLVGRAVVDSNTTNWLVSPPARSRSATAAGTATRRPRG
jgi:phosphatidylglycerol:prolipoprotein diacylglycerol transferase